MKVPHHLLFYVARDGADLSYREVGEGRPIVLLEDFDSLTAPPALPTDEGSEGLIEYVSSHAPDSETGAPTWTESWSYPGSPTSRIQTLVAEPARAPGSAGN